MDTLLPMKRAAALLGVHPQTLRAWDRSGVLAPVRMPSGQRRYRLSDIEAVMGKAPDAGRSCGIYARVSTRKQEEMGNIARQQERLVAYATANGYKVALSASDVASGLNTKRRGLAKLIRAAQDGAIAALVIEYPDRLARFGYEYLERLFGVLGVELVVTVPQGAEGGDAQSELVNDLLAIVSSFAARLYGAQGGREVRQQVAAVLAEAVPGGQET
ncbi:MAG: IS607 family transposase [Candidatus Dormibacteria bacterium]